MEIKCCLFSPDIVAAPSLLAGALLRDEQRVHGNTDSTALRPVCGVSHLTGSVVMDRWVYKAFIKGLLYNYNDTTSYNISYNQLNGWEKSNQNWFKINPSFLFPLKNLQLQTCFAADCFYIFDWDEIFVQLSRN